MARGSGTRSHWRGHLDRAGADVRAAGRAHRSRVDVPGEWCRLGSWAARLPTIQERLRIGEGALGAALLGATLGLFISVALSSALIEPFGSRNVTIVSGIMMITALPLIGLAPSFPAFAATLLVYGAANGAFDLAANSQAVAVERAHGRPIMASFHALFSAGALVGAVIAALSAASGVLVEFHLLALAVALITWSPWRPLAL